MLTSDTNLINNPAYSEIIINELNKNNNFKAYIDQIINDKTIDINDKKEFEDCVKTKREYLNKINFKKQKDKFIKQPNKENVDKYVQAKRDLLG